MKKYEVILHPDAELDIQSSFEWGCRHWGGKEARLWVRELRHSFRKQLTLVPFSCPTAPESEELGMSVRHLIVKRYRVLFIVRERTVTIIHVRGPYPARSYSEEEGTSRIGDE